MHRNNRLIAATCLAVLALYGLSYIVLRATRIFVHYQSVHVRELHGYSHTVFADHDGLNRFYWPARYVEISVLNRRFVAELDDEFE